jgi:adenylylsulfate kinase
MVLWLLGISGAGKTTIGRRLHEWLEEQHIQNYLLDGDEVRSLFDNDLGYERTEREANIKRMIMAAYVLDRCDICTIVCCIAPFEHLRALARRKIKGYHEIYLKRDLEDSKQSDVKGVYGNHENKGQLIGIDIAFDEPTNPDLILDTGVLSVEETYRKVQEYIMSIRDTGDGCIE